MNTTNTPDPRSVTMKTPQELHQQFYLTPALRVGAYATDTVEHWETLAKGKPINDQRTIYQMAGLHLLTAWVFGYIGFSTYHIRQADDGALVHLRKLAHRVATNGKAPDLEGLYRSAVVRHTKFYGPGGGPTDSDTLIKHAGRDGLEVPGVHYNALCRLKWLIHCSFFDIESIMPAELRQMHDMCELVKAAMTNQTFRLRIEKEFNKRTRSSAPPPPVPDATTVDGLLKPAVTAEHLGSFAFNGNKRSAYEYVRHGRATGIGHSQAKRNAWKVYKMVGEKYPLIFLWAAAWDLVNHSATTPGWAKMLRSVFDAEFTGNGSKTAEWLVRRELCDVIIKFGQ